MLCRPKALPVSLITFDAVSKSYPIYASPSRRLREIVTFHRRSYHEEFWALRDVSFEIPRGETFCIIGENGSGKSTLLQIVAGILVPTRGSVGVTGRVSALLELGSGFNPEYTGRDNVYLNAAILGFQKKEIDQIYPRIIDFAEIGPFIDQPVKTYSSGMAVRLAFAVAIHVDPEILIVDEALAVGDIYFRQRCLRKVHELRSRGVTILFVSHSTGDVKAIGDRVLWLENGRVRELGPPDLVVAHYLAAMTAKDTAWIDHRRPSQPQVFSNPQAPEVVSTLPNVDHRFGDGRAEILGIAVLDTDGVPLPALQPGRPATVRISARATAPLAAPNIGFMLRNHLGIDFSGTNTTNESFQLPPMNAGDVFTVDFHLNLPALYPGTFSFSPAIADGDLLTYSICDWIDNAITLQMDRSETQVYGFLRLPCRVELNKRIAPPGSPSEARIA